MKKLSAIVILIFLNVFPLLATWSIVAVDPQTGEVGSAGASYTPSVWPILGIYGGHGVVVAQAAGNDAARMMAVKMLGQDYSAAQIMDAVTDPDYNSGRANQQFGLASLSGGTAAFTGDNCTSWAGSLGGDYVMVQGNILVSENVVRDSLGAYEKARAAGLPLAEALVEALAAGSSAGGDRRAGDPEIAAMSAYLAVASPGDKPNHASSGILVPPLKDGGNPVTELKRLYEADKIERNLFFPSMNLMILLLLAVPALFGFSGFFLFERMRKKNTASKLFVWLGAIFISAAIQQIFILILKFLGWALPVYGFFAWMLPAMLVVSLIVLILLVILIRAVYRKILG